MGRERNTGNQFWKQGKGRQEHRELEIAAKQRRNKKKDEHEELKVDDDEADMMT